MYNIVIENLNGAFLTYDNAEYLISGGSLIIILTKSEVNEQDEAFLIKRYEIFELNKIRNFTTRIKTKRYAEE